MGYLKFSDVYSNRKEDQRVGPRQVLLGSLLYTSTLTTKSVRLITVNLTLLLFKYLLVSIT